MRQIFLVLVLIVLGCNVSLAQQQTGQVLTSPTSNINSAPVSRTPVGFDLLRLVVPAPSFNQSQADSQTATSPQVIRQEDVFVVRGGAVYMPLLNGTVLVGIPGGGASSCFSLYLPQRITALNEYLRKLPSRKQSEEMQY